MDLLPPLGTLAGARLMVDLTDTRVKDKTFNFNGHKHIASIKSLIFTTEAGALLSVKVGWSGNESELHVLESSEFLANLQSELAIGHKFFLADGSLRNPATYFPIDRPMLAAGCCCNCSTAGSIRGVQC